MAAANNQQRKWISEGPYKVQPDPRASERRAEQRFDIQLGAHLCLLDPHDHVRSGEQPALIHDVSQGGLRFTSPTPMRPGESALIRFKSPGGQLRTRRVAIRWAYRISPETFEIGAESWQDIQEEPPQNQESAPEAEVVFEAVAEFVDQGETEPASLHPPRENNNAGQDRGATPAQRALPPGQASQEEANFAPKSHNPDIAPITAEQNLDNALQGGTQDKLQGSPTSAASTAPTPATDTAQQAGKHLETPGSRPKNWHFAALLSLCAFSMVFGWFLGRWGLYF